MSASSPVITSVAGETSRHADVRVSISRLYSRRLFWHAAAGISMALACALAAALVIAVADYGLNFRRAARTLLLLPILLGALFIFARSVLVLLRSRTLSEMARE